MIKFEFAKKKNKNKIQKFIDLNFKKNHILAKSNKFFNWLYVDKKINCIVALENNIIIGIYLFVPLNHYDKKINKNHIFFSTWTVKGFKKSKSVNKNKQGVAIAYRMLNKVYNIFKSKLIISVGIDHRLVKFHNYKNFKTYTSNHHFLISPYVKKFKILKSVNILQDPFNKKEFIFENIDSQVKIKKISINHLFQHQIPQKSKNYIINRYMKHPIYKYYIYTISSKEKIFSLFVFRVVKAKGAKVIRLIDYFGSNKLFVNAKTFFYEILKIYKAEYLDFYSFGIPLNILNKSGLKNRNNYKNLIIADYFEPFVNKNINVPVGIMKSNFKGNVRIFKGDGDQDRPHFIK